ncbi:MAG: hypothetical protein DRP60_03335 [Spirochaetes bacterium]|nr:MAG: hypothetical protein DRP60_03335 [Spirochaetota bacterium]
MYYLTTFIGYISAFFILLIILLLVLMQSLIGNQKIFDPLIKFLSRVLPAIFGIRVVRSGLSGDITEKPVIFMANHVNIFDVFILYGHIPSFIRAVELEDHFHWPIWGAITRRMGNIPISHKNTQDALKSLDEAHAVISRGTSMAILPEGHRTRDGELQPFMRGPFRLAKMAKVDIIPVVMKGLWERKAVGSLLVLPGKVELVFGERIQAESFKEISDRELKDNVRGIILSMLE